LSSAFRAGGQAPVVLSESDLTGYRYLFELRFNDVRREVKGNTAAGQYITNLSDALELLLNEDPGRAEEYLDSEEKRFEAAESLAEPAHSLWIRAETRFHLVLINLKLGKEWDAAWEFRQCYNLVRECTRKFPEFWGIRKLDAILSVMLGSAPPRFEWVLNLLGMEGSVQQGISRLEQLSKDQGPLAAESRLWLACIQVYLLQDEVGGLSTLNSAASDAPLVQLARATLLIKASQSGSAVQPLLRLRESVVNVPLIWYLSAEVDLQRGDYDNSAKFFLRFLADYRGMNLVKDAWFKLSICRQLLEDPSGAAEAGDRARNSGSDRTEADKHARTLLAEATPPNLHLARIRFATDGGFYGTAKSLIDSVKTGDLRNLKDSAEFVYRKARLLHKMKLEQLAVPSYIQAIRLTGTYPWYFAPNSALQLGYIEQSRGNSEAAADWFRKALSYRRHEYKNSIDTKARSALDEISRH
jgi:tetratricopeptide (TPR) repeat protein